jgi:hypothetical protein
MSEADDRHRPMRLDEAVRECFPGGGITVSSLRTEHRKGRLVIERIAGKDCVTRAAIEDMRRKCRIQARDRDSISGGSGDESQSTSSVTERAQLARDALLTSLGKPERRSKTISRRRSAPTSENVVSMPSRSQRS